MQRIKYVLYALTFTTSLWLITAVAHAGDYITGYAGYFNIGQDFDSPQFGIEYRGDLWRYDIRPIIGINVNTDGGVYGYAGLHWDWSIAQSWWLIPNFAVGAYSQGDSEDLGGALEFRSGLELAYEFEDTSRVGIAFNHISNASIYDDNPGAETLMFTYSYPLGGLFHR